MKASTQRRRRRRAYQRMGRRVKALLGWGGVVDQLMLGLVIILGLTGWVAVCLGPVFAAR